MLSKFTIRKAADRMSTIFIFLRTSERMLTIFIFLKASERMSTIFIFLRTSERMLTIFLFLKASERMPTIFEIPEGFGMSTIYLNIIILIKPKARTQYECYFQTSVIFRSKQEVNTAKFQAELNTRLNDNYVSIFYNITKTSKDLSPLAHIHINIICVINLFIRRSLQISS